VSVIDLKQGKNILIQEGKLYDCMKASMAFPGILPRFGWEMELVSILFTATCPWTTLPE